MSLRRFAVVVGVLLGLLVMHGLAPGHPTLHEPDQGPTVATAPMPMPMHGIDLARPPAVPAPAHHDNSHMQQACVAVLSSFALWLLLALGLAGFLLRRFVHVQCGEPVRHVRSPGIERPPDLGQLCVLRI